MSLLEKEKEYQESTTTLLSISERKHALEATTNDGCTEAKPILDKFEERYNSDIQVIFFTELIISYNWYNYFFM